jgi:hypothetical protein
MSTWAALAAAEMSRDTDAAAKNRETLMAPLRER